MVTIAFDARPEKTLTGQGIIDWYTDNGYLGDFLDSYAEEGKMSYNGTLYEITFTPNESWPKDFEKQALAAHICLANPDDGKYLIDGYLVESKIRLIDGKVVDICR